MSLFECVALRIFFGIAAFDLEDFDLIIESKGLEFEWIVHSYMVIVPSKLSLQPLPSVKSESK